ncbi:hypothetical protein Ddc_17924 [Ditylenchus destructor]|nr:hypothetical protein Ddc_17924 [Ditylenchus destructor]
MDLYGGMSPYNTGPPPPPMRYSSSNTAPEKPTKFTSTPWRESIGVILAGLLCMSILFSVFTIFYYAQRDKAVYEELVDYLDKTVSISKINYNPVLGLYELRQDEIDSLGEHRRYKALIWTFLFSDLGCYIFLTISLFLYYSADLSRPLFRILFWAFLLLGTFYALVEAGLFAFLIFPYSGSLPNSTEVLLDHAVPHNPGGLMQMEHRFGCIFNQNLYNAFKRKMNPGNTCDPYVLGSFLSQFLLIFFCATRLVSVMIFAALASVRNPVGDLLATTIIRSRPTTKYKNRYIKNPHFNSSTIHTPKSTTFGIQDKRSDSAIPPPATPPAGQLDHSISYNNAAFFAIAGAKQPGLNSSRSSDISNKCEVPDIVFKGSTHTTNSLVSEV